MRILLLLVVLSFATNTLTQKPLPRIMSPEDFDLIVEGVSFAYDIEVGDNGLVYFTGQDGLYSFNGEKLRKIKTGMVYGGFSKGYDGKLWAIGFQGYFGSINENIFVRHPVSDTLNKIKNQVGFNEIYQTPDKTIHLAPRSKGYYTVDSTKTLTRIFFADSIQNGLFVHQLSDGTWFHFTQQLPASKEDRTNLNLYFLDENLQPTFITELSTKRSYYETVLIENSDNTLTISPGTKELIRFNKEGAILKEELDSYIIKIFLDSRDNLWIGTVDRGIYKANPENFEITDHIWNGASAVVAEDEYGGLWFKSDSSNFGYISPMAPLNFSSQNGFEELEKIYKITQGSGNEILVQNMVGLIFSIQNDTLEEIDIPGIEHLEGNRAIFDYPLAFCYDSLSGKYWFGFQNLVRCWDGENWEKYDLKDNGFLHTSVLALLPLDNGSVMGITRNNLFEISAAGKVDLLFSTPTLNNVLVSISKGLNDEIWIGTQYGIITYKDGKTEPLNLSWYQDKYNQRTVIDIFKWGNHIYAQTHPVGLYQINKDKCTNIRYRGDNLFLNHYAIDSDNDLWAITSGSNELMRFRKNGEHIIYQHYGMEDFAFSSKLGENLTVTDDYIYAGSTKGLFKIPRNELEPEKRKVKPLITEVIINQKKVDIKDNYELAYNENQFNIGFETINFRQFPSETEYKLEGIDKNWLKNNYRHVQYYNLDPGDYTFYVRAKEIGGNWSKPEVISFHINKAFWQTIWFQIGTLLAIAALIYLIFYIRMRRIKRKQEEKSKMALEIAQLELRALKAQMNPHFIFNSITSAMFYLSKNENEKAESYLRRFSRLIRKVLETSNENLVPLKEEVELMRQYILLESERFEGEKIQFLANYEGLDPDETLIPPTLIQPYIENAIRHGLKLKEGDRIIRAVFKPAPDAILVEIEDNGIGRKKALELDTRINHKSFGMLISSRRIEVLNKGKMEQVMIEDLVNESGKAKGTKVIFKIPFKERSKSA